MQEMSAMFGMPTGMGDMSSMFASDETLVLNKNNALVKHLIDFKDDENKVGTVKLICEQIYDLAMLSHKPLEVEAMTKFISRSNDLMSKLL
jgi:molecular chaperone HtpG